MTATLDKPATAFDFQPKVDPVQLSVLGARLSAISVEMAFTLRRTSRSLYVKEGGDFSASLLGLHGQLLTIPEAAGSPMFTILDCTPAIEAFDDLEPGDVIITNDPYVSQGVATHLPDVQMIQPYFVDGRLVGYGWAFIHSSDIGGRVPSSISPFNTEIYQDGLQIPPVRYVRAGTIVPEVEALVRANNRTPDANTADFRAMLAALATGQRRVAEIVAQVGVQTWLDVQEDLLAYSAARASAVIANLRPGTYEFSDYLDNDAITPYPVRYRVAVTASPDGVLDVDFTGTDVQVISAFNIASAGKPHPMLLTRYLGLLLTLDPSIPLNGGIARPVRITAPRGSVVNAEHPAAVGVRHASAVRINDALAGAFAAASPETQAAAGSGLVVPVVVSEKFGFARFSKVVNSLKGGFGGARGRDGLDGKDNGYISHLGTPVEFGESELAVTVLRYALRPDSGGAGQWRGGCGRELVLRIDKDDTQVLGRGLERFVFRPWGFAGGRPGLPTEVVVNEGLPGETVHQKIDTVSLNAGETITFRTPGGGGYGNPLLRDVDAVIRDVRNGLVTVDGARRDYGVVLHVVAGEYVLDDEATALLRAGAVAGEIGYDVGPERTAWDRVFDDAWYSRFVTALFAQDAAARHALRAKVFDEVLAVLPTGFPAVGASEEQLAAARAAAAGALAALEG